jgi:tetratricopeptide (TPR) repeat protein
VGLTNVALIHADRAIDKGETDAEMYAVKGLTHAELGQYDEALEALARAAELGSKDVQIYACMGILQLSESNIRSYKKQCAQVLRHLAAEATPADLATAVYACVAHPNALRDYQPLIARCQQAATRPGARVDPLMLGMLYFRAGSYRDAVEHLELGMRERAGGDPSPGVEEDQGDSEVDPYLTGYQSLETGLPEAWIFLAMSYAHLNDTDAAQYWLAQAQLWLADYQRQRAARWFSFSFAHFIEHTYGEARNLIPEGMSPEAAADEYTPGPEADAEAPPAPDTQIQARAPTAAPT